MSGQADKNFYTYVLGVLGNTQDYEVDLQFYLTRNCNLACQGCYMQANPNVARNIVTSSDVDYYLNQFDGVPGFCQSVVFSGGEIFVAPIEYLQEISQNVLKRGWHLQLKTNGAWIKNPKLAHSVADMLHNLTPRYGICAETEDIKQCVMKIPRPFRRLVGPVVVYRKFPLLSSLDIAISVDNKLHPEQSADWFLGIVDMIAGDKKLRKSVGLKTFSFDDSADFFQYGVLENPAVRVKKFEKHVGKWLFSYYINGKRIESYFGKFIDVTQIPSLEKIREFVLPSIGGSSKGRLVYCFHPDKTVGLDSCYLETVGRVPYIDENGQRKTFEQINQEIAQKLIADYKCAKTK